MRRFILCKGAYSASAMTGNVGAIVVAYNKNGVPTATLNGTEVKDEANIVLCRAAADGGNIIVPIHKNKFSFVKMTYQQDDIFKATLTIPKPNFVGDYTVIIAKKGVNFNERNKWTATVHVSENDIDAAMTAAQLAEKIKNAINNNVGSDVTASVSSTTLTIIANKAAVDYKIITADQLSTITVNHTTIGGRDVVGHASAAYIKELANAAAADAGFTDTFEDSIDFYKNYPLDPLAGSPSDDTGYTIFTLKFAEPRATKTIDQAINQIVQVAFPKNAAGIDLFETVCKGLAGEVTAEATASEE